MKIIIDFFYCNDYLRTQIYNFTLFYRRPKGKKDECNNQIQFYITKNGGEEHYLTQNRTGLSLQLTFAASDHSLGAVNLLSLHQCVKSGVAEPFHTI